MPRLPATELINHIEDKAVVIADGAMGTELIRRGALASETLRCNRTHPDWVKAIHHEYIEAGARLLYSNTFAPPKSRDEYADVVAGLQILRKVCRETKEKVWAALSLYPTTVIEHPILLDQILALPDAPDLIVIETCCLLDEAKRAIREIRNRSAVYIFATATFNKEGRMLDGTSVGHWLSSCKANRDLASYGLNCDYPLSGGFVEPFILKPNAGLPDTSGEYKSILLEFWVETLAMKIGSPVSEWNEYRYRGHIIGGCCGTTPEHICALAQKLARPKQEQVNFFDIGRHG